MDEVFDWAEAPDLEQFLSLLRRWISCFSPRD